MTTESSVSCPGLDPASLARFPMATRGAHDVVGGRFGQRGEDGAILQVSNARQLVIPNKTFQPADPRDGAIKLMGQTSSVIIEDNRLTTDSPVVVIAPQ